eukprot:scaffold86_cov338-Pavlova_lutheri.AAC.112
MGGSGLSLTTSWTPESAQTRLVLLRVETDLVWHNRGFVTRGQHTDLAYTSYWLTDLPSTDVSAHPSDSLQSVPTSLDFGFEADLIGRHVPIRPGYLWESHGDLLGRGGHEARSLDANWSAVADLPWKKDVQTKKKEIGTMQDPKKGRRTCSENGRRDVIGSTCTGSEKVSTRGKKRPCNKVSTKDSPPAVEQDSTSGSRRVCTKLWSSWTEQGCTSSRKKRRDLLQLLTASLPAVSLTRRCLPQEMSR